MRFAVALLLLADFSAPLCAQLAAPRELSTEQIQQSAERAAAFLLADQNENGSWGSQKNAHVGIDEFWSNVETHRSWRVATTGLCLMTLRELQPTPEIERSYDRGVEWLTANALVKRPSDWDTDNVWGYIYALQGLAQAYGEPRYAGSSRRDAIEKMVEALLGKLARYQTPEGGWGYYDTFDSVSMPPAWSTSFSTAAGVLALLDTKAAGFAVDPKMLDAAVRAVRRCKLPNGAYTYGVDATPSVGHSEFINQVKGSLGRIQVCNLALLKAGDEISVEKLRQGLTALFREHRFLDVARKRPIPHEAYYANSGYFYFFAHHYAAQVIQELPSAERPAFWKQLAAEVVKTQERDGSMWDYPMNSYGKPYGTAFGLMVMQRALGDLRR